MKVSFLDGASLADKLPDLMSKSVQLDMAMAYVKIGALRTLLKNANKLLRQGSPLRIVFGLSSRHGITDNESAELLLKLSRRKAVTVKKWNNCGFHPKLLILHGHHPCVVVGSANLTIAAQSTNAEANILVENATPQLMQDAVKFFEHYFIPAPNLTRKDVDAYKLHTSGKISRERGAGRRYEEDEFPSPLQRKHGLGRLRPKRIWKIAPGKDAKRWPEWLKLIDEDGEGVVAVGWDEVGDLNGFNSYESLRKAVTQTVRTLWPDSRTKYITDQLWTFKTDISEGDVFIVYSESRVLGVAEVTSESRYQYWGFKTISYGNQINVKYWWYKDWPRRADDRIVETLGKHGTLQLVEENWLWEYLLRKLP